MHSRLKVWKNQYCKHVKIYCNWYIDSKPSCNQAAWGLAACHHVGKERGFYSQSKWFEGQCTRWPTHSFSGSLLLLQLLWSAKSVFLPALLQGSAASVPDQGSPWLGFPLLPSYPARPPCYNPNKNPAGRCLSKTWFADSKIYVKNRVRKSLVNLAEV